MGWISNVFKSFTGSGSNSGGKSSGSNNNNDLLTAVLGAGVGFLDYALDYRNARKEATKAYERNIASAQMQNEYNSPVNAMQRLRDAGLNPNLIYGSVHNNAASISSAPVVNPPSARFNLIHDYMDLRQQDAMTQQIEAQTGLANAQADALRLENAENEDNGTSRGTPYPIKLGKQVANTVDNFGSSLGDRLNSYVGRNSVADGLSNLLFGKSYSYGRPSYSVRRYSGGGR